jgi:cyclopropane-fatty-acyl-phospholipid synthase
MTTATTGISEREAVLVSLGELFPKAAEGKVGFQLWDGTRWPDDQVRAATLVLKHPGAARAMFAAGTEKGLAEAYLHDDFDVIGDVEEACGLADALTAKEGGGWLQRARMLFHLKTLPKVRSSHLAAEERKLPAQLPRHSLQRDRAAIAFHYDVSNDFYRLWLDSHLLYSCAYFETPHDTLEQAQTAKLRHLCQKLRLRPGQRLLDIGCGWGGLSLFAAEHYGVEVTGVTLSREQAALAAVRVAEKRLISRVNIELKDYRDLHETESFDAIVSVGMAEHVGRENLPGYFERAFQLLRPGGVFLNHAIGDGVRARPAEGLSFIQEYVFPDSDVPPISVVVTAAEGAGFEVRDVENLREHYALTLRHWVRRLESAHEQALKFVNEATYRVWRLYMAGSARSFSEARLAIYQTLLAKPGPHGEMKLPLTRRDWYGAEV